MVASATGQNDPQAAIEAMQSDPETLVRLRYISAQNEASIRQHIEAMERIRLEDEQASHSITQATVQAGDKAEDRFVRWTRPGQSWASLLVAFFYVLSSATPEIEIIMLLLALPWAYAGLRQVGKSVDALARGRAGR